MVFWADQVADEIISRDAFKYIERPFSTQRHEVETGTSISGVPHIGNASDIIRGEAIRRALAEKGIDVTLSWVADDMDPFRKVPSNLPPSYKEFIGMPVCSLPDPFGCCDGYVDHYVKLFITSLERFGVRPIVRSGRSLYTTGQLSPFVRQALEKRDLVREILDKYRKEPLSEDWIPYSPICASCGKIATTRAVSVEGDKVAYVCEDTEVAEGTTEVEGCGYEGTADISKGNGKLPWKPEWAARWALFGVTCEPFGKEHATIPGGSFWVNGELCERVFDWPEPHPVIYEFVLAAGGQKMSSSKGNTVSTWEWPEIAPPEVLKLFFYKKLQKQREFDITEIPRQVDDLDQLERVFFGLEEEENEKKLEHLRRLYTMCQVDSVTDAYTDPIPFRFAAIIAQIVPDDQKEQRALDLLHRTGHLSKELTDEDRARVRDRLDQAGNWVERYAPPGLRIVITESVSDEIKSMLTPEQRAALQDIGAALGDEGISEEALNKAIFDAARARGLSNKQLFAASYRVLLGKKFGPRLAPFLLTLDRDFARQRLGELA